MGFRGQLLMALVLNLALKVLTFGLSTLLTRLLLPAQSGLAFSYAVYVDSVLFIAREAVRNAASRLGGLSGKEKENQGGEKDEEDEKHADGGGSVLAGRTARHLVALGFLTLPIAALTMIAFEALQAAAGVCVLPSLLCTAAAAPSSTGPYFNGDGRGDDDTRLRWLWATAAAASRRLPLPLPEVLVWASVLLSASVEPCLVLAQSLDLYRVGVLADFAALMARLLVTIALVAVARDGAGSALDGPYQARLVFALGQLAFAGAYAGYCLAVCSRAVSVPSREGGGGGGGGGGKGCAGMVRGLLGGSEALSEACRAAESSAVEEKEKEGDTEGKGGKTALLAAPPLLAALRTALSALPFPYALLSPRATCAAAAAQGPLLRPFAAESALRLVLTEGEGFALSSAGSATARGYYQLVRGLGSLVARLVFRVWENACFARWSRDVALGRPCAAAALLAVMVRAASYFGLAFALLGPPSAGLFLTTVYTARWATAGTVAALQLYCYAIPCMAVNGLLEAFVRAVGPPEVLRRQQRVMLLQSAVYVAVCYAGLVLVFPVVEGDGGGSNNNGSGADGQAVCFLIAANIVSMLSRIGSSLWLLVTAMPPVESTEVADGDGGPLITAAVLRAATPLGNAPLTAVLVVLFAVSRVVAPTLPAIAAVGVAYIAAVLALDAAVREAVLAVVGRPLLRRVRGRGAGT